MFYLKFQKDSDLPLVKGLV